MTDYTKLADELMPKKRKSVNGKDCTCNAYGESECGCGADWSDYSKYNQCRDDCTPIVADLLRQINELEAGSIEVGVEEIEEIIETWFVKQESILSNEQIKEVDTKGVWQVDLKSLSFDEIKKGLAQAILNNNKEKE